MKLSIVLPTLNEAQTLPKTLEAVRAQRGVWEVIVADGGSTDGTQRIAEAAGVHVVPASRGRARQMNAGAMEATGDILLFLHADTLLPPGALDQVRSVMEDPAVVGGCFRLRFDMDGLMYRFYSRCTHVPWPGMVFGDRAIFARAATFRLLGGYPDVPIFEDLEFALALDRSGKFAFLSEYVTTSARRFEQHGPVKQQLRNAGLFMLYTLGVPPTRLQRFYM